MFYVSAGTSIKLYNCMRRLHDTNSIPIIYICLFQNKMLCGCTGLSSAAKAQADDTYSKDDSGVYTGGEDNMSLIKAPVSAHKKAVVGRGGSFLKSDQAYPGCFNWNKGFSRRSMDDLGKVGFLLLLQPLHFLVGGLFSSIRSLK